MNMQNPAGFYVAHRKTCARCDGEGWVINEEYERFLERYGSRKRYAARAVEHASDAAARAWTLVSYALEHEQVRAVATGE